MWITLIVDFISLIHNLLIKKIRAEIKLPFALIKAHKPRLRKDSLYQTLACAKGSLSCEFEPPQDMNYSLSLAVMLALSIGLTIGMSSGLHAQSNGLPIDSATGLITFQGIVDLPDLSQAEAYEKAREWIRSNYKDPGSFFTIQDAEQGKLEGKHRIPLFKTVDKERIRTQLLVKYTLTMWFKDGRYRYRMTNFNLERASYYPLEQWLESEGASDPATRDYALQVNTFSEELIESLKAAMAKPKPAVTDENDW